MANRCSVLGSGDSTIIAIRSIIGWARSGLVRGGIAITVEAWYDRSGPAAQSG